MLAAELGEQKIRVNCLLPGAVFTEINNVLASWTTKRRCKDWRNIRLARLGRIGSTEEIAEAMAYLICAEWVTGAMIDIDGGLGWSTRRPAVNQCKETS